MSNFNRVYGSDIIYTNRGSQNVTLRGGGTGNVHFDGYHIVPNQIEIRKIEDFPDPIAGDITLAANTQYLIEGAVDITPNRIIFTSLASISGISAGTSTLITNNTTEIITIKAEEHCVNQ